MATPTLFLCPSSNRLCQTEMAGMSVHKKPGASTHYRQPASDSSYEQSHSNPTTLANAQTNSKLGVCFYIDVKPGETA